MDLLYESDHNICDLEDPDMGEILDHDAFQSPSSTSSEGGYMDDWLNSLFEDPVLNDKMITEAVPSPRIQSEHSYSINNEIPQSPLGLPNMDSNVEDLDSTFFSTTQALDLSSSKTASVSAVATSQSISALKSEPVELADPMLTTVTTMTTRTSTTTRQPTIILATTSSSASKIQYTTGSATPVITQAAQSVLAPTVTIKAEPFDLMDNQMEQTVNMDSLMMPPTPPSSASSDSDGSLSPSRSAPSSPVRQLPYARHPSPSSKTFSQPIFTNPIPQSGILLLTEEEKRTLVSEGYPIPGKLPLTKQEEKNLKKIRRKIKNKISAQESRRKKKEYLEQLEKRVEAFSQENNDLKKKVNSLEHNNQSLLGQLHKLQSLVGKVARPATSQTGGTVLMVLVLCFAVFLGGWNPSSLNVGYSSGSHAMHTAAFFGNPRMMQPSPRMGPPLQDAKVDAYSTPNMKSRVLLSLREESEDSTWYEPYAPHAMRDHEYQEDVQDDKDTIVTNPALMDVTSTEESKVMEMVTVDHRVHQPNNTEKTQEQALLHPDIQATAGFHSQVENIVETS
ncbi:cyclic AMP-responsive element-binding protein 3-like protein 2 [Ylistrum balloti]|uniref:cyclic AMP-responsive element-binding protein 3-like protein 2 n=1 Tax=Ylistrum balloti TaxID=509963 RepID=UPI0029057E00|nr:cyclic AMP-responsive element-binding protein 3-like protein 2 [Ylistrum balloti]